MKKLLKRHPDFLLLTYAIILLAIVIGSYSWGIGNIVEQVNRALTFTPSEEKIGFDLEGAAALDLRGLLK